MGPLDKDASKKGPLICGIYTTYETLHILFYELQRIGCSAFKAVL